MSYYRCTCNISKEDENSILFKITTEKVIIFLSIEKCTNQNNVFVKDNDDNKSYFENDYKL